MILYASGVPLAELAHLLIADIDSDAVIRVRGSNGRKDRDVILSPNLLEELRQHYRRLTQKPDW